MEKLFLKPRKEMPVINKHHWVFSGAVMEMPDVENGEIVEVYSSDNELLGHAMVNKDTVIAARMINFDSTDPIEAIKENIRRAIALRQKYFQEDTNAYRLVNGEGDNLSGLVIDKYDQVIVMQIVSTGFDKLKELIKDILVEELKPVCVYEKSTIHARRKEGLESAEGVLYGKLPEKVVILENGVKFVVDVSNSQKTGLFLDQRDMREMIGKIAKGKSLLNCFSYTGGFSIYAAKNGAKRVVSVDIEEAAIENSKLNFKENGLEVKNEDFVAKDAFRFLHDDDLQYDIVILDPPAFAKKKEDIPNAKRGYLDINRTALRKMPKGSFLLTCSCSYHVDEEMFEEILEHAAFDAGRSVRIVGKHRLASDHPINIYHSEINYLKSLLLYID